MRVQDWPERLAAVVQAARGMPYALGGKNGSQDCISFAATCHTAMCGDSPISSEVGTYESRFAAAKRLQDRGFKGLGDYLDSLFDEVGKYHASRGDFALFENDNADPCIGVVLGPTVAFVAEDGGLAELPIADAVKTWRVE